MSAAIAPSVPVGGAATAVRLIWRLSVRGMLRIARRPSLIIPTLIMPVFLLVSFSGSFSGLGGLQGYGTDNVYNWMTAYAVLQGVSFAGVGAAGMTAEDMENGFYDRLLLVPGGRLPLLLGPIGYSLLRSLIPTTMVLLVAYTLGSADVAGGVAGVAMVYLGAFGVATAFACLGLFAVFILKSMRALLAIQVPIFMITFLSIGQVPLSFQTGWLHAVSRINPITPVLTMMRQGFLGPVTWADSWPGLVALLALVGFFGIGAWVMLRRMAP